MSRFCSFGLLWIINVLLYANFVSCWMVKPSYFRSSSIKLQFECFDSLHIDHSFFRDMRAKTEFSVKVLSHTDNGFKCSISDVQDGFLPFHLIAPDRIQPIQIDDTILAKIYSISQDLIVLRESNITRTQYPSQSLISGYISHRIDGGYVLKSAENMNILLPDHLISGSQLSSQNILPVGMKIKGVAVFFNSTFNCPVIATKYLEDYPGHFFSNFTSFDSNAEKAWRCRFPLYQNLFWWKSDDSMMMTKAQKSSQDVEVQSILTEEDWDLFYAEENIIPATIMGLRKASTAEYLWAGMGLCGVVNSRSPLNGSVMIRLKSARSPARGGHCVGKIWKDWMYSSFMKKKFVRGVVFGLQHGTYRANIGHNVSCIFPLDHSSYGLHANDSVILRAETVRLSPASTSQMYWMFSMDSVDKFNENNLWIPYEYWLPSKELKWTMLESLGRKQYKTYLTIRDYDEESKTGTASFQGLVFTFESKSDDLVNARSSIAQSLNDHFFYFKKTSQSEEQGILVKIVEVNRNNGHLKLQFCSQTIDSPKRYWSTLPCNSSAIVGYMGDTQSCWNGSMVDCKSMIAYKGVIWLLFPNGDVGYSFSDKLGSMQPWQRYQYCAKEIEPVLVEASVPSSNVPRVRVNMKISSLLLGKIASPPLNTSASDSGNSREKRCNSNVLSRSSTTKELATSTTSKVSYKRGNSNNNNNDVQLDRMTPPYRSSIPNKVADNVMKRDISPIVLDRSPGQIDFLGPHLEDPTLDLSIRQRWNLVEKLWMKKQVFWVKLNGWNAKLSCWNSSVLGLPSYWLDQSNSSSKLIQNGDVVMATIGRIIYDQDLVELHAIVEKDLQNQSFSHDVHRLDESWLLSMRSSNFATNSIGNNENSRPSHTIKREKSSFIPPEVDHKAMPCYEESQSSNMAELATYLTSNNTYSRNYITRDPTWDDLEVFMRDKVPIQVSMMQYHGGSLWCSFGKYRGCIPNVPFELFQHRKYLDVHIVSLNKNSGAIQLKGLDPLFFMPKKSVMYSKNGKALYQSASTSVSASEVAIPSLSFPNSSQHIKSRVSIPKYHAPMKNMMNSGGNRRRNVIPYKPRFPMMLERFSKELQKRSKYLKARLTNLYYKVVKLWNKFVVNPWKSKIRVFLQS